MSAGKGDKRRKENYKRFLNNFDGIKWKDKPLTKKNKPKEELKFKLTVNDYTKI